MTTTVEEKRETFTPGDWHVQDLSLPHSRKLPYLIINDDVHSVARVCQEQDARLIAAAPEMYELCKLFEKCMERIDGAEYDASYELAKVRAVLAKVEGGGS